MKKKGFTIVELLISLAVLGFLLFSIGLIYLSSTQAVLDAQVRTKDRTKLSQAMDLMSRQLRLAQSITVCNATTLTFGADLGSGLSQYTYSISGTNLLGATGAVIASDVQPASVLCAWSNATNQLTLNLTTNSNSTTNNTGEKVTMTTTVSPVNPLVYGLVGWWKINDGTAGNTCSGATVLDASGSGNTGTCQNTPTWVNGPVNGGALNFNGGSQLVAAGNPTQINNLTTMTVAAWAYVTAFTNTFGMIISKSEPTLAHGWGFYTRNARTDFEFSRLFSVSLGQWGCGSGSIATGKWYHVVVTQDGTLSVPKFYINGQLSSTTYTQVTPSGSLQTDASYPITLGGVSGASTSMLNGVIEDVRVYNRILSAAEVQQLYNARL